MDTSEIEAWTLEVAHRLKTGAQLEDRRVELKREWPTSATVGGYTKAARQLGGLANANHPEPVLWLVGIDEQQRQVVGANAVETAKWWSGVGSCFDGDPPGLADVAVMVDGQTVVALCFDTSTAPFVVKNPLHGSAGHVIASEVPWRDGTRLRTIGKHELRTLLAPQLTAPEVRANSAMLRLQEKMRPSSQFAPRWSGSMSWTVESLVPKRVTLSIHRMTLQIEIPDHGYSAPVRPQFIETRGGTLPGGGSDVRYVGHHVFIDGPGIAELMVATFEAAPPLPPDGVVSPATLTLTMPAPGLPSPIVVTAILAPSAKEIPKDPESFPEWEPTWFLRTPLGGDI